MTPPEIRCLRAIAKAKTRVAVKMAKAVKLSADLTKDAPPSDTARRLIQMSKRAEALAVAAVDAQEAWETWEAADAPIFRRPSTVERK